MSQIDYRKFPVKELYLYMNLVIDFCADMRCLSREGKLTADAIDKYEMTVVSNLITEVNSRSRAATRDASSMSPSSFSLAPPLRGAVVEGD